MVIILIGFTLIYFTLGTIETPKWKFPVAEELTDQLIDGKNY